MPSGLLPDEGIGDQLGYILSADIEGVLPWQLVLWVNDIVPDSDTVFADLEEATWNGYSRQTLDRSTWSTPVVLGGCATSTYGIVPIEFRIGDGPVQTNYGAAYYDESSDVIRWIQRFEDADIFPIVIGGTFAILPQYTLTSSACGSAMRARRKAALAKKKR